MLKRRQVTLDIVFDPNDAEDPVDWDFAQLLDAADSEHVKLVGTGPLQDVEEDDMSDEG